MAYTKTSASKSLSLPMIHVQSVTPTYSALDSTLLTSELRRLMQQVTQLRQETVSLTCNCSSPDCPFNEQQQQQQQQQDDSCNSSLAEKESPDLGFGSMELLPWTTATSTAKSHQSFPAPLPLHPAPASVAYGRGNLKRNKISTSLTNIPRGVQKRADGTIIEQDYPGFYSPRSRGPHRLSTGFSMSHLNRLEVCFNEELEADCQVDQDGLTSNHNYLFTRKAPERRNIVIRREQSNGSTSSQRRKSEIPLPTFKQSLVDMVSNCSRHSSIGSTDTAKPTLTKRHSMISA